MGDAQVQLRPRWGAEVACVRENQAANCRKMGFLMSSSAVGEQHRGSSRLIKAIIVAAKLAVTGACFWYLARNVDFRELLGAARTLNVSWTALAVLVLMLETPIIAVRWCWIVDLLGQNQEQISRAPMIAITLIANFFAQVMPNIAADTIRAWMLRQHGHSWGRGLVSVMIDRGVGIACLLAVGFVVLLFPSSQAALGGQRVVALEFFGLLLVAGFGCLIFARQFATLLQRSRYTAWAGHLALSTHRVLLGHPASMIILALGFAVHLMSIVAVWLLAQASGLALLPVDAAVLFTVMVAVMLVPLSIGGWGIRELAVTSLLKSHGIPFEQALFFSVCFGLILLAAALPGALVWTVYSPARLVPATASDT
jgi:glycosyltransferase 2 family protein